MVEDGSTTTRSRALRVLFLSSDTGGGHRASAEALGAQFASEFPGSTFELLDVLTDHGCAPYRDIVPCYRHLSARPRRWKLVYEITNTRFSETVADVHLRLVCERRVRNALSAVDPDVVVSVHPMMNRVPAWCCQRVGRERGRHLPFFTVVTDLGGAHSFWFCGDRGVEAIFVATDRLIETAENECRVPRGVARRVGLPIRRDFAVEAERLGNRCDDRGRAYQATMRRRLFGDDDARVTRNAVLVMGGGEGVGSLRDVVRALHARSRDLELDVTIVVVCGRNETLRRELQDTDWDAVSSSVAHPLSESPMIRALRLTGRQKEILSSYAKTMKRVYPEFFGGRRDDDDDDDEKNGGGKDGERDFDEDDRLETSRTTSKDEEREDESRPKTKDDDDDGNKVDSNDVVENVDVNKKPVSSVPFFRGLFDFVRPRQRDDGGDNNPDPQRTEREPKPEPKPKPSSSSSSSSPSSPSSSSSVVASPPRVVVLPLGFVSNVAEHMVAADALVTKAGPGTIAEAAALGLPVLLTSFLPGQERGNVDHVVSRDFGAYRPDRYPGAIASEVGRWLRSRNNGTHRYRTLVANALRAGDPYAARDIARSIGESALRWRESSTTTTTTTTSDPVGAER